MLWGGLRPIAHRIAIDVLVLLGFSYSGFSSPSNSKNVVLVATCLLLLGTSGLTDRWTLTLPMVPFVILQIFRRIPFFLKNSKSMARVLHFLSFICIITGAALCVLFPAVELPPHEGPHNVGVLDFHLNAELFLEKSYSAHSELPVRLFYPTLEEPEGVPLFNSNTVAEFCRQTMLFGAPPPLKPYDWILHTWKLTSIRAKWNAELLPGEERLPLVVYSHGLGGTAEVYTYQATALASQGNFVLMLNHQDGSAPVVHLSNGTILTFDHDVIQLHEQGKHHEYVTRRRDQTDFRAQELIAATEAMLRLDKEVSLELRTSRLSLQNRLAAGETFWMGHSFGGATALTAAKRRPDLVKAIVAHEPAIDWMPHDARRALYPEERLEGIDHSFGGGTGGWPSGGIDGALHDINMLLLFSQEWAHDFKYSSVTDLIKMHEKKRVGPPDGISEVGVIDKAHHSEFADTCMLTPLWMGRETGLTGSRNPLETAKEIHHKTMEFLHAVRRVGN